MHSLNYCVSIEYFFFDVDFSDFYYNIYEIGDSAYLFVCDPSQLYQIYHSC